MKRRYAVRIALYTKADGCKQVCITFGDDAYLELLDKGTYFSVKRTGGRLAFVGWKNKMTGATLLNNNMLQYALADDVETVSAFVGEYNVLRDANDTMMFVSLEDKRDFSVQLPPTAGTKRFSQADVPTVCEPNTLVDILAAAINEVKNEIADLIEERNKAMDALKEIESRKDKADKKLIAYTNARIAAGGELDMEADG